MKRLTMGSQVLITDDRIADLVLTYAGVLARSGSADTVRIPVVGEAGQVQQAQLLIGPASQIVVTEDGTGGPDLAPGPALDEIEHRMARYGSHTPDDGLDPQAYVVQFDDYEPAAPSSDGAAR
ncbi:hypothetical protein [uncultured Amnibacterium sp.]|uniref:hypothetical protein n=1 Tax=uncultured Amnibacterium sp. TaxID=1631851 RepID=UPI0035CAFADD